MRWLGLSTGLLAVLASAPTHADPPTAAGPPTLALLKSFEAHAIRTRTLVFDDRGTILVSGGSDRRVRIWDAKTLRMRASWAAPAREHYKP